MVVVVTVVTVTVTVTIVMICPLLLTPVCKRPGEVGGKDGRPAPEAMRPAPARNNCIRYRYVGGPSSRRGR